MHPIRLATAALACCLALLGQASAGEMPKLADTALFRTIAQGCRTVDLASWHHPVRAVLNRPGVTLTRVDLCNADRYPVFYVDLQYDPMGHTDSFFHPLYGAIADANGYWPFALVALRDGEIVEAATTKRPRTITLSYETFTN